MDAQSPSETSRCSGMELSTTVSLSGFLGLTPCGGAWLVIPFANSWDSLDTEQSMQMWPP